MSHPAAPRIILASSSPIRAALLVNAGLDPEIRPARIDEETIRASLAADGTSPRDQADMLAELKARRISQTFPDALVIGCNQILECEGQIFAKPTDPLMARDHLIALRGRAHCLLSAAVICQAGVPLWRHVGTVRLTMRDISDAYLDDYLARNWPDISEAVGCYKLESEGVRLFSRIEGNYFVVLGIPLIELLTWLGIRGDIPT